MGNYNKLSSSSCTIGRARRRRRRLQTCLRFRIAGTLCWPLAYRTTASTCGRGRKPGGRCICRRGNFDGCRSRLRNCSSESMSEPESKPDVNAAQRVLLMGSTNSQNVDRQPRRLQWISRHGLAPRHASSPRIHGRRCVFHRPARRAHRVYHRRRLAVVSQHWIAADLPAAQIHQVPQVRIQPDPPEKRWQAVAYRRAIRPSRRDDGVSFLRIHRGVGDDGCLNAAGHSGDYAGGVHTE